MREIANASRHNQTKYLIIMACALPPPDTKAPEPVFGSRAIWISLTTGLFYQRLHQGPRQEHRPLEVVVLVLHGGATTCYPEKLITPPKSFYNQNIPSIFAPQTISLSGGKRRGILLTKAIISGRRGIVVTEIWGKLIQRLSLW
jgi:hypothetical protein